MPLQPPPDLCLTMVAHRPEPDDRERPRLPAERAGRSRMAATGAPVPVSEASSSSQVSRRRATLATPSATTISAGRGWPL